MRVVYKPPRQQVSEPTERSGNFGQTFGMVLFLAFGAAGLFHFYRNSELSLPQLQQRRNAPASAMTLQSPGAPAPAEFPAAATESKAGSPSLLQRLGEFFPPQQASWSHHDLAEFSLDSPVPLTQRTPSTQGLAYSQLQQVVQRFRWEGMSPDGFQVQAEYFEIDGMHTLSLEDGVKGSIRTVAARVGDSAPVYRSVPTFVNGLSARRISYAHSFNGMNWHVEEVVAQANRKMFFACVIFPGETRAGDAQRVLNSLNIHIGS
jgi:hypothetical protein